MRIASIPLVIPPSGTFRSLRDQLDVIIDTMGFRILQLLPIHPTPTTYARMGRYGSPFAALDFYAVDELAQIVRRDARLFGFSVAAEVLFNKFALHVPLYRQQDPFAQLGWTPSRSTLSQIVANSADLLRPLAMLETRLILASGVVNTDDTPVTLLTPREGKGSRKARFWIYRSRQPGALYDAFAFTDNRSRAGPDEFRFIWKKRMLT